MSITKRKLFSSKCFFCEYDYGPAMIPTTICESCEKYSNFIPKKRMSRRQACIFEDYKKLEKDSLAMTPDEAIRRIKQHMYIHRIGEYPHIYLARAFEMAIEALEKQTKED